MKKLLTLTAAILTGIMLMGCGASSSLLGHWKGDDWLSELEFFSDGTYTSSDANHSGGYSVDGDRLKLNGILMEDWTFTYDVRGNTLSLYDDDGDLRCELTRVK